MFADEPEDFAEVAQAAEGARAARGQEAAAPLAAWPLSGPPCPGQAQSMGVTLPQPRPLAHPPAPPHPCPRPCGETQPSGRAAIRAGAGTPLQAMPTSAQRPLVAAMPGCGSDGGGPGAPGAGPATGPAGGVGAMLCSHGVPLAACSHAVEHLRDVKSFLLDVCEELLDRQPGGWRGVLCRNPVMCLQGSPVLGRMQRTVLQH